MSGARAEGRAPRRLVLVTGPAGAGRTTAIRALEDLGFEVIDNLPLSLLAGLLAAEPDGRPLALGIDSRTRGFSVRALLEVTEALRADPAIDFTLLYLDCAPETLRRRYSETRRRHPLAAGEDPEIGIAREIEMLAPIRERAGIVIDTTALSPHDLRAELERWFGEGEGPRLTVTVRSFSYRRGVPIGADLVFDVRFLRNPHWEPELRPLTGRDQAVQAHVEADPAFAPFVERVRELLAFLLPLYQQEGKAHLTVAFGCTGGRHRSVSVAERIAAGLEAEGWQVSIRHAELERRGGGGADDTGAGP